MARRAAVPPRDSKTITDDHNFALIFQAGRGACILGALAPLVLIFGVFYFLIIIPQRKRQKALQEMISQLKPGDKIITSGGIYATVKQVKENPCSS